MGLRNVQQAKARSCVLSPISEINTAPKENRKSTYFLWLAKFAYDLPLLLAMIRTNLIAE
jgi:hypothetical protein